MFPTRSEETAEEAMEQLRTGTRVYVMNMHMCPAPCCSTEAAPLMLSMSGSGQR